MEVIGYIHVGYTGYIGYAGYTGHIGHKSYIDLPIKLLLCTRNYQNKSFYFDRKSCFNHIVYLRQLRKMTRLLRVMI